MNTRNTIRLNHSNRSRIVIVPTLECGSSAAAFATFSLPPKPTVNHNLNPAKGHLFLQRRCRLRLRTLEDQRPDRRERCRPRRCPPVSVRSREVPDRLPPDQIIL